MIKNREDLSTTSGDCQFWQSLSILVKRLSMRKNLLVLCGVVLLCPGLIMASVPDTSKAHQHFLTGVKLGKQQNVDEAVKKLGLSAAEFLKAEQWKRAVEVFTQASRLASEISQQFEKADTLVHLAIGVAEKHFPAKDPVRLFARKKFGDLQYDRGNYEAAIRIFQDLLTIEQEVYP